MRLNADIDQRVAIRPGDVEWTPSPMRGVERRMLERIGGEVARATSIVRYAAGSRFSAHTHGGEEFLVLDGVFSDGNGDYPAGTLRSQSDRQHACAAQRTGVHTIRETPSVRCGGLRAENDRHPTGGLASGTGRWPARGGKRRAGALGPGTRCNRHRHWGGEEILVVEGTLQDEHGDYPQGSWLRNPHLSEHTPFSTNGCTIYVKTGHLVERLVEPAAPEAQKPA